MAIPKVYNEYVLTFLRGFIMRKTLARILGIVMAAVLISTMAYGADVSDSKPQELTGDEWDAFTLGEDYFINENGDVVYNYVQTSEVAIVSGDSLERTSAVAFVVKVGHGYDPSTKELTFFANIDYPSSLFFKPDISISLELQKSTSKFGLYSTKSVTDWVKVNYSTDYTIRSKNTAHYNFIVHLRSNTSNFTILTPTSTFYTCRNRTGKIWDYYHVDANSGATINEPPTDWAANALYTRPSNLNKQYQDYYNSKYGTNIVVGDATKIDVHHIRPLKYGGSNSMYNLIHIDSTFHSKITGWFNGY